MLVFQGVMLSVALVLVGLATTIELQLGGVVDLSITVASPVAELAELCFVLLALFLAAPTRAAPSAPSKSAYRADPVFTTAEKDVHV